MSGITPSQYRCQPPESVYVDYMEQADGFQLAAFLYDESSSEPGFDEVLACHLTQLSPFRAAAVLDLLSDQPQRLETIKKVLKNHTTVPHYSTVVGASRATVRKTDNVSPEFKGIPEAILRTDILLGAKANSCTGLVHNHMPIPVVYEGVIHRAKVTGSVCFSSMVDMTLIVSDADYQPPPSLAAVAAEVGVNMVSTVAQQTVFGMGNVVPESMMQEAMSGPDGGGMPPPENMRTEASEGEAIQEEQAVDQILEEVMEFDDCLVECEGDPECELEVCYEGDPNQE
jgi:hypothetical protein